MKIFEDLTLGAIVRDELMNPAGGILPFIKHHAKMFPNITILDTGSIDGTYELLQKLKQDKYSNINLFQTEFENYSKARNDLLRLTDTTYSFQVDADEYISKEFVEELKEVDTNKICCDMAMTVYSKNISPQGLITNRPSKETCEERILNANKTSFTKEVFEGLTQFEEMNDIYSMDKKILHFEPYDLASSIKRKEVYVSNEFPFILADLSKAPSSIPEAWMWKLPGKKALNKINLSFDDTILEIESYGIKFPEIYKNAWKKDEKTISREIYDTHTKISLLENFF